MADEFKTQPVSLPTGVEILEFDLIGALSNAQGNELRSLLDRHQMLLFRNQAISPEDQIRIMSLFGPVADEVGNGARYSFVSNVRADGLFGEWQLPFHSDFAFTPYQPPVFSLYGEQVEGPSVPTVFANCASACRSLPEALRIRLDGMNLVNCDDFTKDTAVGYGDRVHLLDMPVMPPFETHPRTTHPVLRPHPRTGEKLLFVTEMHTSHIEGLSSAESENLLADLFSRLYAPDNVYTHHWKKGDLVIWDNVALQHGRKFQSDQSRQTRRTLRRVAVSEKTVKEILAGTAYKRAGGFDVVKVKTA